MFMDAGVFKKMVTHAYKGVGLSLAREKGRYIIAGGYWCMRIRGDCIPNKAKAAVVELVGGFPDDGENFIIRHKEEKRPGEFNPKWWEWINDVYDISNEDNYYQRSNILMEQNDNVYRYWQNEKREVVLMEELFTGLVEGNIMRDKEEEPDGPVRIKEHIKNTAVMYWFSNSCELFALTATGPEAGTEEDKLWARLEEIELPGTVR